jgi:hypothetical protein
VIFARAQLDFQAQTSPDVERYDQAHHEMRQLHEARRRHEPAT